MAALAQCDAFAFIYDQAGDPAPDVLVVLKRVLDANRNPILLSPKTTTTDSAGSYHFTLPEFATAFIFSRASELLNCPDGKPFTVPAGPSGELIPEFSLPPSTLVEPPLVYVGDVLSIPKASATQDGYLSAADYVAFLAGTETEMGVVSFNTRSGEVTLLSQDISDALGFKPLGATIPGVAGTYPNPTNIVVNAQGQIISITSGAPDTTPPVISAIATSGLTATGVTVTWTTNEPADSQVEYGTSTSYGTSTTLNTTPVSSHSVPITGLTASTLYHYRVKSKDTAGNPTTSGDNTFTTTAVVDTTPPVISAIAATSITDTGATITWTSDEGSDSQVEYGLTTSYGSTTTLDAAMVTSHSVPITGTTAATLYHYRVKSRNNAGLLTTSGDNTFTTAPGVSVDLLTNLIAYWKLDETADYRFDASGNGNTLTPSAAYGVVAGKFNNCIHADGTLNDLYAANGSFASMGASVDYTIAAWIQIEDKTAVRTCISKVGGGPSTDEYILRYVDGTGTVDRFSYAVAGGGTYFEVLAASAGAPVVGQWYLVVIWHKVSDNTVNIQVNNGPVDSFTLIEPPSVGSDLFALGSYGNAGAQFWFGLIDEVAIWKDRILTPEERTEFFGPSGAGKPFDTW